MKDPILELFSPASQTGHNPYHCSGLASQADTNPRRLPAPQLLYYKESNLAPPSSEQTNPTPILSLQEPIVAQAYRP